MEQIEVIRLEDGSPAIECPVCGEGVQPAKNALFDGHQCPSCDGTIDSGALRQFTRALRKWEAENA